MNNYDLPLDLIIEILSWLPVRSLVRFKCVSKSWYDLIKDPTFIKLHLHRSLERKSNTYIIDLHCCKPCNPEHISIYSFRGDYKQPYYQLAQLFLPKELELALSRSRIHGSCNGLLCISTLSPRWNSISLSLYNPATRAMKRLPPLCPRINPVYTVFPYKVALAYDSVSDDYKVFTSLMLRIGGQRFKFHKTMLYSLKSDAWEDIHNPPSWSSGLLFQSNRRTIFTNNSLHWLMTESKIIRCFDLITQRCDEIPFPDTDAETRDSWYSNRIKYSPYLTVLRGQLCMVMHNLDIWILKEYGKPKSWVRIFHDKNGQLNRAEISDFWNNCSPRIGCIKDGHSIMLVNCKAKDVRNFLICCDLKSEEARKIEVPSLPELRKPFSDIKDMEPWVESLVTLQ